MTETAELAPPITLTARAARQIAKIIDGEGEGTMLRVAVQGGGCSGFQYGFTLDDSKQDDDLVLERDGVTVLIDAVSVNIWRARDRLHGRSDRLGFQDQQS